MKNLKIKVQSVPVSDSLRLEALMPTLEFRVWEVAENQYEIRVEKMVCATVNVVDGEFDFDFAEEGYPGFWANRLVEGMLLLNPELDPDRPLWIVVYPWKDSWSYFGSPKATKEAALENIVPSTFLKPGAMLVEFKASEWPGIALKVDQSFELVKASGEPYRINWIDQGEKIFRFTPLENFVTNEE